MRLDCDCGFVARGDSGPELAAAARAHARETHLVDLATETILALVSCPRQRLRAGVPAEEGTEPG